MDKFKQPDWLQKLSKDLPEPSASNFEDKILFCWDKWEHHFEVEIHPNGIVDFFYRNRLDNGIWFESWHSKFQKPYLNIIDKFDFMKKVFDCKEIKE